MSHLLARLGVGRSGFGFGKRTVDSGLKIGDYYEGGYFAGYISHTADGVATHGLIVAPADTGASGTGYPVTTDLAWQTTISTTGATSGYDGAYNTALMTNSPAADFCTGLTIDGYSDWYLPSLLELDIAYYNLKPTTDNNDTSRGYNLYSVPPRAVNYTTGDPAQTAVTLFQTGNAQYFPSPGEHHSSTETNFGHARGVDFSNASSFFTATGAFTTKQYGKRVRAFRKFTL